MQAVEEIRAALEFYANEYRVEDSGDRARRALGLLSALSPESATPSLGRNWPEDFSGENGNYTCKCVECGNQFIGHKRRVVCKLCATPPAAKADDLVEVVTGAIYNSGNHRLSWSDPRSVENHPFIRADCYRYARAVLTALDIPRREAEAVERERERCDGIVCAEWQQAALLLQPGGLTEKVVARILAAIRSRSQPAAKAQGGGG